MKYLQKRFSSYANYEKIPSCDKCKAKSLMFTITISGKLCKECYEEEKKNFKRNNEL
jgi:hypothetical protein